MNIGDKVVLKDDDSLLFRIIDKRDKKFILSGFDYRLILEKDEDELSYCSSFRSQKIILPDLKINTSYLKGKVLHLDGDEYYLNKALRVYKYYSVPAVGFYVEESQLEEVISSLLDKYCPDILVLTGHDGLVYGKENELNKITSYRYSNYYANATKKARMKRGNLDDLIIISGACQSYYELLIKSGSNFASSPNRKHIHLYDPVIIASLISSNLVGKYLETEKIINFTLTKEVGGLDTAGKARKIYPVRENIYYDY